MKEGVKTKKQTEKIITFPDIEKEIQKLDENSSKIDFEKIFEKIPPDDPIMEDKVIKAINVQTGIGIRKLDKLMGKIHGDKKLTPQMLKVLRLQNKYPNNGFFVFGFSIIELSDNEINLVEISESGRGVPQRIPIAKFDLKFMWVTKDRKMDNIERYVFESGGDIKYNFTIGEFLRKFDDKIFKGSFGRDVIKFLFLNAISMMEKRTPSYILGFDNGWYLPLDEANSKYSIIIYTDEQRNVLNNCRSMYKSYNQKEKDEIKEDMKKFIKITRVPSGHLAIIIAYSIIAPFKLFFMKKYNLFPSLIMEGAKHTGKTTLLDFYGNHFYGHYPEHMSGQTAKSIARLEDTISASTFPRVIDELNKVSFEIVDVIKEMATSVSDYKRKTSAVSQFSKPKITPLIITSNDIGSYFKDSANSSRAIIIDLDISISRDDRWIKLRDKLRNMKLFSLVYDYTKDWTDKDVANLATEAIGRDIKPDEKKKTWKTIGKTPEEIISSRNPKLEQDYPRIMEIFKIILAGVHLFEKVFSVKLDTSDILPLLVGSRRSILEDLVDKFYGFCDSAKDFDPLNPESRSHRYLTNLLETRMLGREGEKEKTYIFTQDNLHDFNTYNQYLDGRKYSLRELGGLIQDAIEEKDLVKYTNIFYNGKNTKVIRIKMDFISGKFSRKEVARKEQRMKQIKDKDEKDLMSEMFRLAKEEASRIEEQRLKHDPKYIAEKEEYERKEELDKITWKIQQERMKKEKEKENGK